MGFQTKKSLGIMALAAGAWLGIGAAQANDSIIKAQDNPDNWPYYGRTYENTRFSPLKQITTRNVGKLKLAYAFSLGSLRSNESTPIVIGDTMYVSSSWGPKYVYALDAATGDIKWTYQPDIPDDVLQYGCCDVDSRGVTYADGKIFVGRLDGNLTALDAKTGNELWTVQGRRLYPGLAHHLAAAGRPRQGHHRLRRRRVRRARQPAGLRHQDRQAGLEDLDRAGAGRAGRRQLEG